MNYDYRVVDVFTQTPLEGNALAVFTDARGMTGDLMQRVARELNLSETTFVFPAEREGTAARVRIFTPGREMEFAGHPTLGTAYVLRALGRVPGDAQSFVLHENIGDVPVRVDSEERIWLTTPAISVRGAYDRAKCAAALSLSVDDLLPNVPCELLTAGNPNIYVPVRDAATVDRAEVDTTALRALLRGDRSLCTFVFAPTPFGAYSRMFAPEIGVAEDPATGSATGPLAAFMLRHNLVQQTSFYSEQGTKMGRRSILHVLVHGEKGKDGIEVGGHVTPLTQAVLTLP